MKGQNFLWSFLQEILSSIVTVTVTVTMIFTVGVTPAVSVLFRIPIQILFVSWHKQYLNWWQNSGSPLPCPPWQGWSECMATYFSPVGPLWPREGGPHFSQARLGLSFFQLLQQLRQDSCCSVISLPFLPLQVTGAGSPPRALVAPVTCLFRFGLNPGT